MKIAWRDLFTYSSIPPNPSTSSCPCQTALWKVPDTVGWGWKDTPLSNSNKKNNCQKTVFSININDSFPSSICSIDHLALSSINLQNALFKLLINTLIDLQKCHHTEARAADGSEPTAVQLPTVRKWWMSEWMCILQSARQCRWFLGWGMQVN